MSSHEIYEKSNTYARIQLDSFFDPFVFIILRQFFIFVFQLRRIQFDVFQLPVLAEQEKWRLQGVRISPCSVKRNET